MRVSTIHDGDLAFIQCLAGGNAARRIFLFHSRAGNAVMTAWRAMQVSHIALNAFTIPRSFSTNKNRGLEFCAVEPQEPLIAFDHFCASDGYPAGVFRPPNTLL